MTLTVVNIFYNYCSSSFLIISFFLLVMIQTLIILVNLTLDNYLIISRQTV